MRKNIFLLFCFGILSFFYLLSYSLGTYKKLRLMYSEKIGSNDLEYQIFIDENGVVNLFEKNFIKSLEKPSITVKTYTLTKDEFENLKKLIKEADVFNLKNEYADSLQQIEYTSKTLTVTIDEKTKTIVIGAKSLPMQLSKILIELEKIKEKLIFQSR